MIVKNIIVVVDIIIEIVESKAKHHRQELIGSNK